MGACPFHVQKTEDACVPEDDVNVTRSQPSWVQTCICQPALGVAETSDADAACRSSTTRPPRTG